MDQQEQSSGTQMTGKAVSHSKRKRWRKKRGAQNTEPKQLKKNVEETPEAADSVPAVSHSGVVCHIFQRVIGLHLRIVR